MFTGNLIENLLSETKSTIEKCASCGRTEFCDANCTELLSTLGIGYVPGSAVEGYEFQQGRAAELAAKYPTKAVL